MELSASGGGLIYNFQSDKSFAEPHQRLQMAVNVKRLIVLFTFASLGILLYGRESQSASLSLKDSLARAQELIQQGNLREARDLLAQAAKEFPNIASPHSLLGVVEAQEGNLGAAESHFLRAVALSPDYEGAYLNLGRLYQQQARSDPRAMDNAIEIYERLLKVHAESIEANYQLAALYNQKGSFRRSLDSLNRIPLSKRDQASSLTLFCANYAAIGELQKSKETADRLSSRADLREADVLMILPVLSAHEADDVSVRLLEALDRRGLASFDGLYSLASIYKQQGRLGEARDALLRTTALKPDTVPVLIELARIAEKQKDFQGALSYLAHARDLDPDNGAIHFFFGMICIEMDLIEEAYRSLKQAVKLDPENAYYNYAMGVAAEQKTFYPEAVEHFQKYNELKPDDIRGGLALGIAHFYNRDRESARKELDRAAQHLETAAGANYFLARMASQEGDLDQAVERIQQTLQRAPDFAGAYAELGNIHLKRNEYEEAENILKRAVALDKDNYRANLYLVMLYTRMRDPRAKEQTRIFEEVKKKRTAETKEFYRLIEVRRPE